MTAGLAGQEDINANWKHRKHQSSLQPKECQACIDSNFPARHPVLGHYSSPISGRSGNHVVPLHEWVVLIALHGRERVVDMTVACLVSAHIQDQVPHAGLL